MNSFVSKKVTLRYVQINNAPPEKVFPLLCPVREKDWLDGWDYKMIYSKSGFVEDGCVFSTPNHGKSETIWTVTKYDPTNFEIAFVRFSPGESVVRISIKLEGIDPNATSSFIAYEYTSLSAKQNHYFEKGLARDFTASMLWWDKAINHYLETGEKLLKNGQV